MRNLVMLMTLFAPFDHGYFRAHSQRRQQHVYHKYRHWYNERHDDIKHRFTVGSVDGHFAFTSSYVWYDGQPTSLLLLRSRELPERRNIRRVLYTRVDPLSDL